MDAPHCEKKIVDMAKNDLIDSLLKNWEHQKAIKIARASGDETVCKRVLEVIASRHQMHLDMWDINLFPRILKHSSEFFRSKRIDSKIICDGLVSTIMAAYNLSHNYDFGIGIVNGGRNSAYFFNMFGLPIIMAETHRNDKSGKFTWYESPQTIRGKKIIILEWDVVTGVTLNRTLHEIDKYSPASIDLYLNDTDLKFIENIQKGFGKIHYPELLDYGNLYDAIKHVAQAVE